MYDTVGYIHPFPYNMLYTVWWSCHVYRAQITEKNLILKKNFIINHLVTILEITHLSVTRPHVLDKIIYDENYAHHWNVYVRVVWWAGYFTQNLHEHAHSLPTLRKTNIKFTKQIFGRILVLRWFWIESYSGSVKWKLVMKEVILPREEENIIGCQVDK